MRSPVAFSMAQATHFILRRRAFLDTSLRKLRPFCGFCSHTFSDHSKFFSPRSSISNRKGLNLPQALMAAVMNCEDQPGRPSTMYRFCMIMSGSAPRRCDMFKASTQLEMALGFWVGCPSWLPYLSRLTHRDWYCFGTSVELESRCAALCMRSSPPAVKKPIWVSAGRLRVDALSSARLVGLTPGRGAWGAVAA